MRDLEYLSVANLRQGIGQPIADLSDEFLRLRLDQLSLRLEDILGHTFGRALQVWADQELQLSVNGEKLSVGDQDFLFADHDTLADLANAINEAGSEADIPFSAYLLPRMPAWTPSSLLSERGPVSCGPGYANRVTLGTTALYFLTEIHHPRSLFLPLPLQRVISIYVGDQEITNYVAKPGDCWIELRQTFYWPSYCQSAYARITYVPTHWGNPPPLMGHLLAESFASAQGLGPFVSESFGGMYSYRRSEASAAPSWDAALASPALRPYCIRFYL